MFIDQLTSLVDDAAACEPWTLTDAELRVVNAAVHQARAGLDALAVRLASAVESRGIPAEDGATSTTAWLSTATGLSRRESARLVGLSRLLTDDSMPTFEAWSGGQITTEQAAVILRAVEQLPEWCGVDERSQAQTHLIGLAADHPVDDLKRLANRIVEVIDPDGADEIVGRQLEQQERHAWDATRLVMRRRGDGTTRGAFVLPDADADALRATVEGLAAPRRRPMMAERHSLPVDELASLPHAQRLGLAFVELISHLPTTALPQAGGLAATVAVTVPIDVMRSGVGSAVTTGGTEISAAKARRLACNARLVALYLDSASRVVDHGMTRRLFDRHQRLALAIRDRGCVWAGCDRPPAWCEAHHLEFWSEGGPTDLDNAALFCHAHHFKLHEGEWTAHRADDGIVEVIPPPAVDPDQVPRRHARFTALQPRAA